MKASLLTLAAIAIAALPAVAADTVDGKWQLHQSIAGNESDMSCTFKQTSGDLAGTCDGPTGAVKITGKVAEKTVSWTVETEYNGAPLTLKYSGTLASAEKMSGTVSVDPYAVDGDFTAVLAK
ncbi:MAG: hypothetical protein KGN36_21815 [Acidobacteriota bacterium]|nr:hypothetical protein [Acidobacteriota bacterium]